MKNPHRILTGIVILTTICIFSAFLFTSKFHPQRHHQRGMDKAMEQELYLTRDPNTGEIPRERLLKAEQFMIRKMSEQSGMYSPVTGINWTERGPSNIGGRTRAVIFDINGAPAYKKVWAGGVSGGLWYTNDITVTAPVWNKVNDLMDNLAITTIGQWAANPMIMYAGTGEGWYNMDAVRGLGIWRTLDGGANWAQLPSTNNSNFHYVQKIIVDASGAVYACTRTGGLQKSTDGGITWNKILGAGVNNGVNNSAADVELAPNGDLYCSLGIFGTGKIYRSTNNGASWTDISPPISANRIEIATCPSSSDTLYALFENPDTRDCGSIRRYSVSTATWTSCSVPNIIDLGDNSVFTRGQAWYDMIATVDPNNASVLYIGGVDALRSTDAGATWTQMTTWSLSGAPGFTQEVHCDHHAITYAPGSSSRAIWGTDGGVYYTDNANVSVGKPVLRSKNNGFNVTQYYAGVLHPARTDYFLGGTQDNGSHKFTNPGINVVSEVSGGDGAFCHIDEDNPSVQITSYVYNNYFVSTNGGNTFNTIFKNNRGGFINPADYDDAANILYAADIGGFYFRWNSPASNGSDQQVSVSAFNGAKITHVKVSSLTPNRVYFGLNNGSVVRVDNANDGLALSGTVLKAPGAGSVSCIAIDPSNENHLLVTHSNYGVTSVFECLNSLQSSPQWTSVEGNLPDMPVRWALFDPRNSDWALLATELGVWSTNDINGSSTDWSPTNNAFANVRVNMLDYRKSDGVLLAVTHGRGMFTAVIPKTVTPDISFASAYSIVNETTAAKDSCKGYSDYTIALNIANAPTGDATVALSIENTNAAVRSYDFEYTTNGDFLAPSNLLTFISGANTPKVITIRVYDDDELESNESFTLSYTISGTTNAQPGTGPQRHTVYINDNDLPPVAGSVSYFTVGTPSFYLSNSLGGNGTGQPFDARLQKKKTRFQYRADELSGAGIASGTITSLALNLGIVNSKRAYKNLQIRMGNSSVPNLVNNGTASIEQVIVAGTYASFEPIAGWNTLELTTPFIWNGTSNLIVELCYDNGTADTSERADVVLGYKDGASAVQGNMFWQDSLDCNNNYTSAVFFTEGLKPQIKIGQGVPPTRVATALNTSRTVYLGPYADVYVYSSSAELIARIKNLSSHDYGCTQVFIDREGTGSRPFWNNSASNFLMDKTIQVIPANNSPSGTYEITLFYTGNEVSGWENATGQSFQNIQMVKVQGKISDVTPSNPNGAGVVQFVQAEKGQLSTHRTLTYAFSNGFSGFGAGIVGTVLPFQLIDFTGGVRDNIATLEWATLYERGTTAYLVERSYDGANFKRIGSITAAGNSDEKRHYRFMDREPAQNKNYYRIRARDADGRESLTHTILLRNPVDPGTGLLVLSNPASEYLDILLGNLPQGEWAYRIYDLSGRRLLERSFDHSGLQRMRIDLTGRSMPKGVYVIEVGNGKIKYSKRFIKG